MGSTIFYPYFGEVFFIFFQSNHKQETDVGTTLNDNNKLNVRGYKELQEKDRKMVRTTGL